MDVATFKLRFPEFALTPDSTVNIALSDANLSINSPLWGRLADLGAAYLAAHMLTIQARGASGQTGAVVSESVGELSRTYAQAGSANNSFFNSTAYGQEFLRLRQSISVSPMVL